MLVHGEQAIQVHKPIPVDGKVRTVSKITAIWDKGSGAVIETESRIGRRQDRRAAIHQPLGGIHPRRGRMGR